MPVLYRYSGSAWEAVGGSGTSVLLASQTYDPVSEANITTTSATLADVDATNLVITFTVPASGAVIVELTAYAAGATSTGYNWGLREGSSDVANSDSRMVTGSELRVTHKVKLTGLTPGASKTWKWAHQRDVGSGTVGIRYGAQYGQAVMLVWAA